MSVWLQIILYWFASCFILLLVHQVYKSVSDRARGYTEPTKRARDYFNKTNPTFRIHEAKVRAVEASRSIVAVFYQDPQRPVKPVPYALLCVEKPSLSVRELEESESEEYRIRGRR